MLKRKVVKMETKTDIELDKNREENKEILNKCDVLVGRASADDNSMEATLIMQRLRTVKGRTRLMLGTDG